MTIRSYLRGSPDMCVAVIGVVVAMPGLAILLVGAMPKLVADGYFAPAMQAAGTCVLVAAMAFGISFYNPHSAKGWVRCARLAFVEVTALALIFGVFWLVNEMELPVLGFFGPICALGVLYGVFMRAYWPPRWWWRGLWASGLPRYEVPR